MKKNIMLVLSIIFILQSCSSIYKDPYGRDKKETYIVEGPLKNNEIKEIPKEEIIEKKEIIEVPTKKEEIKKIEIIDATEKENLTKEKENEDERKDFISTLTEEEKKLYNEIYKNKKEEVSNQKKEIEITKPVVSDPDKYKDIKIVTAEIYPEKPKEEKKQEVEVKAEEKKQENKISETTTVKIEKTENEEKIIPKYTKSDYENIKLDANDEKVLRLIKRHYGMIEPHETMELKTKELIFKIRKEQEENITSTEVLALIHEMIKETKTRSFVLAVNRVERNRGLK